MNEVKLTGKTPDFAEENIKKLKEILPDVFTEGKVDFEKLQQVLGNYIETETERYNFTWNGKGRALRLAQTPSAGTLRPCKEESKDWDTTQNLYLEGDNLEILKLLQKSYHGKVKMIYIDPPYNTGKDFVYPDDYRDSIEHYKQITRQVDGEGKRLSSNVETSGRYHSNWLNMMYPRLRLARNLLSEDGVIFISIDDNEVDNLKKICNEIFGEDNFFACVSWHKNYASANDSRTFSNVLDFILIYRKSDMFKRNLLPRTEKQNSLYKYDCGDGKGRWRPDNLSVKSYSANYDYPILNPKTGVSYDPPRGRCWVSNKETIQSWIKEGRVFFGQNGDGAPQLKRYLSEVQQGIVPTTYWSYEDCGHNDEARKEIKALFDKPPFDTPKPTKLLKQIVTIGAGPDSVVLDFFSGSATTAHAVMKLNAEDGGNRKFIMVQLPEPTDEKSGAYKAGYKTISDIGKERIRRAGEMIKSELKSEQSGKLALDGKTIDPDSLDIGFRVFKLDSSNIRKWNPDYDNLEDSLFDHINNYVESRTELDVVYEIMLKYGLDLTYSVDEYTFAGKKVYSIGLGALLICLDEEITTDVATGMVELKKKVDPEMIRVVFRDNGFQDDSSKTNIKEILKSGGIDEFVTI